MTAGHLCSRRSGQVHLRLPFRLDRGADQQGTQDQREGQIKFSLFAEQSQQLCSVHR
jgi:hypothetical protein